MSVYDAAVGSTHASQRVSGRSTPKRQLHSGGEEIQPNLRVLLEVCVDNDNS